MVRLYSEGRGLVAGNSTAVCHAKQITGMTVIEKIFVTPKCEVQPLIDMRDEDVSAYLDDR